jgi:predicted nuclease of predicted toxin-antitoxin system
MRILIDECVPRRFKFNLAGQGRQCSTVAEAGLAGKKNGELLQLAEPVFDVFVTVDQGFEYQQNLAGRKIAVVIIHALSNRFADVEPHAAAYIETLGSIQPGQLMRLGD